VVVVQQGAAAYGPLAGTIAMGFDVQTTESADNPLASTRVHARTACKTPYAQNMHACHGHDIKVNPHRMLALMTLLLMG